MSQTTKAGSNGPSFASARQVDAKHLADLLARLHDPVVAELFIAFVDDSPELRQEYLGACLKAAETVRRQEMRFERARAAGRAYARARGQISFAAHAFLVAGRYIAAAIRRARVERHHPASPAHAETANVVAFSSVRRTAAGK
ncbi:hypothetical protein AVME950_00540 [Acidovorax sp. SUPP950]|uniref:hypothetical protein n=1 Tax=Acidovorax sp. SUPP950 TaxID=511901 RepID=UPI0023C3D8C3|nr:hypothetical protein [Acidovorax sp. SUPP950]GKS73326.1 hypothetical protein AVME950_00540 [Acidovorax sp. SUPP950]